MKKFNCSFFAKVCLAFVMMFSFAGCGSDVEANPLSNKEYGMLEVDPNEDFRFFLSDQISDYGSLLADFSSYIMKHEEELDGGKSFSEFDDFETELDGFYEWCYKIENMDTANVPAEYMDAWDKMVDIAVYSRDCMDKMYSSEGQELIRIGTEMSDKVVEDLGEVVNLAA